jgi:hypothetical protein
MTDKFDFLTLKQAIAVQIFYSSSDDENLIGKTLTGANWIESTGVVASITFLENGIGRDGTLGKLIAEKSYQKIIEQYDKPNATFKIVVSYKNDKDELIDTDLTSAIQLALSPEELPKQIIEFLSEKKEYSFLKS